MKSSFIEVQKTVRILNNFSYFLSVHEKNENDRQPPPIFFSNCIEMQFRLGM